MSNSEYRVFGLWGEPQSTQWKNPHMLRCNLCTKRHQNHAVFCAYGILRKITLGLYAITGFLCKDPHLFNQPLCKNSLSATKACDIISCRELSAGGVKPRIIPQSLLLN